MLPKKLVRNNRSNASYKLTSFKFSRKLFIESSKAFAVLILLSAYLFGQSQLADKTADQSLRSNGRINPSTLGMEIDIPLMNYPGRGLSVPVSLSYSSKLWQLKAAVAQPGNQITDCDEMPHPTFAEDSASGWTTSLARPILEYTGRDNIYTDKGNLITDSGCVGTGTDNWSYIKRLTVHLPGGGSVELRASETPEFYASNSNCNDGNPNTPCPDNLPSKQENWDTVYYAVDGSGMKYIENSASSPNPSYRLYMTDGSHYDFGGLETKSLKEPNMQVRKGITHTDRHGNSKAYYAPTSQNQSQYPFGYWQDTLGRIIPIPMTPDAPAQANVQEYKIPGFGGGSSVITYKLHWKKLEDALQTGEILKYAGNYQFLTQLCPTQTSSCSSLFNGGTGIQSGGSINRVKPQPQYDSQAQPIKFNPIILAKVELPNGQFYDFKYNSFGEITQIDYPTGGIEQFTYDKVSPLGRINKGYDDANRGVSLRKLYENSAATPLQWTYYSGADGQGYFITTVNPDGTYSKSFVHRGNWQFSYTGEWGTWGYDYILPGRVYDVSNYSSDNFLVSKKLTQWEYTSASYGVNYAQRQARVAQEQNFAYDASGNAVYATTKYEYHDTQGHNLQDISTPILVKSVKEYAYVPSTGNTVGGNSPIPSGSPNPNPPLIPTVNPPTLLRTTETEYVTTDANYSGLVQQAYKDRNLNSLISTTVIKDGAGNPKAKSQIAYDESTYLEAVTTTNLPTGWTNPGTNYRGLPTTTRSWSDIGNNQYIDTHASFDQFGNSRKNWDGKGNYAETIYDSTYKTYPVEVRSAIPDPSGQNGSNAALVTTATFDPTTGLTLTTTDANGQTTTMSYADPVTLQLDPLLRIRKVTAPNNQQTINEYGIPDSNGQLLSSQRFVKVKTQIDSSNWEEGSSWFDGLGRTTKTQTIDPAGDVYALTCYDNMGRVSKVSNPFRNVSNPTCSSGLEWTTTTYDGAGRSWKTTTHDSAVVENNYAIAAIGNNIGPILLVTDQAGKQKRSITNALGQLIRVDEPDKVTGSIGDIDSPVQPTYYKYNTLGKLIEVTQGAQQRFFIYDSLGRVLRVKQPEQQVNSALNLSNPETTNTQWTVGFSYDNNGNVLTTTDAKNITTTSTYDNLNRVLMRSYSDGITPPVIYSYDDSNVPLSKGKVTKVSSNISETRYTAYDEMGRLKVSNQRTPVGTETVAQAMPRTSSYTYNLAGILTEQTYPSGRVVKNILQSNGDLTSISSRLMNGDFKTYASNFAYTASGVIKHLQIGNGLWESAVMNTRNQVTELNLGTSSTDGSLWKLNYDYGELNTNGTVDTTKNAGNIVKQTVNFTGLTQSFVQTYKYDSLDRITEAKEMSGTNQTWIQNYDYDRYGNRTSFSQNILGQQMAVNNQTLPSVDANTNRFLTTEGYAYDANGNLIQDFSGRQFTFDGDNKQISVKDSGNNSIGQYFYDGNGKRVKKVTNTETVVFIYDGIGKLVAEYSTGTPAQNPTVNYTATDPLGSPRVLTNNQGQIVSRRDFMPFGEEIAPDGTYRTTGLKYGSNDNIRQKFTGYQRDEETNIDFAEARYYNNSHGRFTAVDPLLASGKSADPQTFNRYAYTMNRPLILTDPTGLQSGKKPNKDKKDDNDEIKVFTIKAEIKNLDTKYLDKTIYNDVPVGGEFEITYTYIVNSDPEGKIKPEDAANIEPSPAKDINGNIDDTVERKGTLADSQNLERTNVESQVTANGNDEGFKVTKTERFRVKEDKERNRRDFNGTINYQVKLKDPATGQVERKSTTDRKYLSKAISISNAPRKEDKKNEEK